MKTIRIEKETKIEQNGEIITLEPGDRIQVQESKKKFREENDLIEIMQSLSKRDVDQILKDINAEAEDYLSEVLAEDENFNYAINRAVERTFKTMGIDHKVDDRMAPVTNEIIQTVYVKSGITHNGQRVERTGFL